MKNIPRLVESDIRHLANSQSWSRGKSYYNSGRIYNLVWREGTLTAEVEGSSYEPYIVEIGFNENKLVHTYCTCPYDWGGDCKHIVATLLQLIHKPESIDQRPALDELLADLNREQLANVIAQLAESHPSILDDLDRIVPIELVSGDPSSAPASSKVDTSLLQRQIRAEVRGAVNYGNDGWGYNSFYESDFSFVLNPAIEQAKAYLKAGDANSALVVLEAATEAWQDGLDSLDEYILEHFYDWGDDFTLTLGETWAEVVLSVDFSSEERVRWKGTLEEFVMNVFGGGSLEIAVAAIEQGWTYPPLVSAMNGNMIEGDVWVEEEEVPYFADELAKIRLRILERRGQFKEYLNLALAEGQYQLYLQMLVKRKESDKAVEKAMEYFVSPADIHNLACVLLENDEIEKAFALAKYGLELEEVRGKASLAAWLRDEAIIHKKPDLVLEAARRALAASVSFANYQAVRQAAGEKWKTLKDEMLAMVAKSKSPYKKVDIYLEEEMYKEVIDAVEQATWFYDMDKVIEAVKIEYPDWAFKQCRKRAERIMNAGDSKNYRTATEWLRKGRDIFLFHGRDDEWEKYFSKVKETHHRKYKLMPMLRELEI